MVDTWVRSLRGGHIAGVLPLRVYQSTHRAHFTQVIRERADVEVLMAVNPQEPDPAYEIYGYLVWERWTQPIVHYVYVRDGLRQMGVARRLMFEAGLDLGKTMTMASCMTPKALEVKDALRTRGVYLQLKHDPRFLRDPRWKEKVDEKRSRTRGAPAQGVPRRPHDIEVVYRRGSRARGVDRVG